jgi:hypothetical protein
MKIQGIEILARDLKNAKICFAYQGPNKRKKYSENKFSPESMRQDKNMKSDERLLWRKDKAH